VRVGQLEQQPSALRVEAGAAGETPGDAAEQRLVGRAQAGRVRRRAARRARVVHPPTGGAEGGGEAAVHHGAVDRAAGVGFGGEVRAEPAVGVEPMDRVAAQRLIDRGRRVRVVTGDDLLLQGDRGTGAVFPPRVQRGQRRLRAE